MPAPPPLVTQAQLELGCGGAQNLLQLADNKGAPTNDLASPYCQAFIAEVVSIASSKVYSLAQISASVTDPNISTPFLVQCAVTAAVYWAWHKSTGGIAIPEGVKDAYKDAVEEVKEYAEGLRAVGATPTPTTSAGLKQVDPNPDGTRLSRDALAKAGFE